jgi:Flp pilus assembly CpaF family ATPase
VDTIVQVSRGSDGSRYVTHVSKVVGYDPQSGYQFHHLFNRFKHSGGGE